MQSADGVLHTRELFPGLLVTRRAGAAVVFGAGSVLALNGVDSMVHLGVVGIVMLGALHRWWTLRDAEPARADDVLEWVGLALMVGGW